jgi:hypothetical protein
MGDTKPLAIDLYCGLGGWSKGCLAEGYRVIGYDIEAHEYGDMRYPAELVLQDVLTIHGSQFKDAALIVASPPCQEYSYMAMPWKLAKAKAAAIRADESGQKLTDLNRLFNACFRIQLEACEAAGRHIPLIVENVRGAQPWVGRARWSHGSFYLWGDVPALMPVAKAYKTTGMNWSDRTKTGQDFTRIAGNQAIKNAGHLNKRNGHSHTRHLTNPGEHRSDDDGKKIGGDWFSDPQSTCRRHGSKSKGRKMASAMIAKIPLPLSRHIAATFHPKTQRAAA